MLTSLSKRKCGYNGDLANSPASEQSSHLRDNPGINLFYLYVNLSHWMLRVSLNPVHAEQQADRRFIRLLLSPARLE
jgi:hypothetical protein